MRFGLCQTRTALPAAAQTERRALDYAILRYNFSGHAAHCCQAQHVSVLSPGTLQLGGAWRTSAAASVRLSSSSSSLAASKRNS